jgi:BirA family biotin operon repressor/biotin-[acetyl-CoA-carboxylase] ligase
VSSTNDLIAEHGARGAAEGLVIVAESQTAGRGRFSRVWHSPPGSGLYVSVLLRPETRVVPLLTLAGGVAICEAVRESTGLQAVIKWPNDLLAPDGRRKLAGILVEVLATMAIVAIVLPVAMRGISIATTLASITRQRGEAIALAESKLNELQTTTGEWQNGVLAGDFGEQWPMYRWEAYIDSWDEADFEQLHVAVIWTSRGADRQVILSTLVSPSTSTGGSSSSLSGSSL